MKLHGTRINNCHLQAKGVIITSSLLCFHHLILLPMLHLIIKSPLRSYFPIIHHLIHQLTIIWCYYNYMLIFFIHKHMESVWKYINSSLWLCQGRLKNQLIPSHICAHTHTHMGLFRLAIIIIVKIVANTLMVCVAKQDKGTSSTLGSWRSALQLGNYC